MRQEGLTKPTVIFAALAAAGILMGTTGLAVANPEAREMLLPFGAALFGAGLAFFLVRIFAAADRQAGG